MKKIILLILPLVFACGQGQKKDEKDIEELQIEAVTVNSYQFLSDFIADTSAFLKKYTGKKIILTDGLVDYGFSNLKALTVIGFDGKNGLTYVNKELGRYGEFNNIAFKNSEESAYLKFERAFSEEEVNLKAPTLTFDQSRPGYPDNRLNVATYHTTLNAEFLVDSMFIEGKNSLIVRGAKIFNFKTIE